MKKKIKMGVIGTGAYGLSLAMLAKENGHDVICWTKFEEEKNEILETGMNDKVLPNVIIPKEIKITNNLEEIINYADLIVLALPAEYIGDLIKEIAKYNVSEKYFCITTKGIIRDSDKFVYEVLVENINTSNYGVLSGPSFAIDIVDKKPVSVSVAVLNNETFDIINNVFSNDYFSIEMSKDIVGVSLCGSIKNSIAIFSGYIYGLNFNTSSIALYFTKWVNDLGDILECLGGKKETVLTLAGIGDLLLTCTSSKSRNYSYGYFLATDNEMTSAYKKNTVIEGLYTLDSIIDKLDKVGKKFKLVDTIKCITDGNANEEVVKDYLR